MERLKLGITVTPYALPTRCSVLTCPMASAMSSTDLPYGLRDVRYWPRNMMLSPYALPTRCPVLTCRMAYAMSSTDLPYGLRDAWY
eukprot:3941693-Rhodomonas_salina.4